MERGKWCGLFLVACIAPAHPHATRVAVYLALLFDSLFFFVSVEVKIPGADQKYTMVKLEKTFDDAHEYCK